jgi:phosphoribosylamine--glycine ligase
MRVFIIGSGGREHAIAWRLRQEGRVTTFCAPGNPGIAEIANCVSISLDERDALAQAAERLDIDLTIVGPEAPLAAGIVDTFAQRGLRVLGPTQAAATLESSKVFMKNLCRRHGIPTAQFRIFGDPAEAIAYVRKAQRPLAVKADGLAGGKGVTVAGTTDEAVAAVEEMMVARKFGDAGSRVVIEEALHGEEISILALCDGTAIAPLLPARDYKRLGDDNRGPNTGGMGAYAPVPSVGPEVFQEIVDEVLEPAVWAMAQEGRSYLGVLFAGMMLTEDGPQVLEFNVRLGDPEAQVVLPLLESDLSEAAMAALDSRVDRYVPRWRAEYAVCVTLAAQGYPGPARPGATISGIEQAAADKDALIFHAGTALSDGRLVSAGGRVLNAVGIAPTLQVARDRAYGAAERVQFDGKVFRHDIAAPAGILASARGAEPEEDVRARSARREKR